MNTKISVFTEKRSHLRSCTRVLLFKQKTSKSEIVFGSVLSVFVADTNQNVW